MALPSPRPPPVTIATLPVRSKRFAFDMARTLRWRVVTEDHLYFRQLLAGRDFAAEDQIAQQMVNFVYLVGDRETGEPVAPTPPHPRPRPLPLPFPPPPRPPHSPTTPLHAHP